MWVDENGKTHYSDVDEHMGESGVETLEMDTQNILSSDKQEVAEGEDKAPKDKDEKPKPSKKKTQTSSQAEWQGEGADTDERKCALARAIIEGGAKHTNGATIDDNDLKVAQRDVSKFCN